MRQRQQLDAAIEDYLRFRHSTDIAKSTLKGERTTLYKLLSVAGPIYMDSLAEFHVVRFFEEIAKTKQPQSQRNDYRTLTGFFDWGRRTGRMARDNDPLYGRRKPKRITREKNRLHVSKFPALLDAAEARSPRDRAVIALGLYTLCRGGEISDLRIRDVDLDAGYVRVRIHKTRQEDRIPICEELDGELRRWLTHYAESVGFLEPGYYLVPARQTRAIRRGPGGEVHSHATVCLRPTAQIGAVSKLVVPALEDIGFPVKDEAGSGVGEGAHTLRRSGARALFDRLVVDGYDGALRIVQSMLHHSSVATTEIYLGINADRRSRDELIRGRRLYAVGDNVVSMHRSGDGSQAGHGAVV